MKTLRVTAGAGAILAAAFCHSAWADDTIKIGVLHSLSGTMAISETTLKDTVLMMVDDLNKKGGLLGKKVEAVVVDPASNWPLVRREGRASFSRRTRSSAIFGCWTSVSRKSVLPVFAKDNGLLFYPVQYEGEESQKRRLLHRRRAEPAGDPRGRISDEQGRRRRQALGAGRHRLRLSAHHQQDSARLPASSRAWPTTTSWKTTRRSASPTGRPKSARSSSSPPAGKKTAVVSTINGDANVPFYKELANQGIKASDIPVVAFSVGEEELAGIDTKNLVGHLAAWNYFESVKTPTNEAFIKQWHAFIKNDKRTTNDPMEATYIGFKMWTQAVLQAGTTDVDAVRQAMYRPEGEEPDRQRSDDATQPSPDQAGDDRRDQAGWPVQRGVEDARSRFQARPGRPSISTRTRARSPTGTFPWVCESCTTPTYKAYE